MPHVTMITLIVARDDKGKPTSGQTYIFATSFTNSRIVISFI